MKALTFYRATAAVLSAPARELVKSWSRLMNTTSQQPPGYGEPPPPLLGHGPPPPWHPEDRYRPRSPFNPFDSRQDPARYSVRSPSRHKRSPLSSRHGRYSPGRSRISPRRYETSGLRRRSRSRPGSPPMGARRVLLKSRSRMITQPPMDFSQHH